MASGNVFSLLEARFRKCLFYVVLSKRGLDVIPNLEVAELAGKSLEPPALQNVQKAEAQRMVSMEPFW